MPSQEFFEQLIVTMKNIQAPQQPSKIVVESRDHKESVDLAKLQNGMLQLMYATGDVNWDNGTVKNICTAIFTQGFMTLLSRLAAVQAALLTNLFNTIFTSKQEVDYDDSALHPLNRLMSLGVGAPLVGELLLELLARGSNPSSGAGVPHVQSGNTVGGWGPTCPIRVYLGVDTGKHTATRLAPHCSLKTIRPSQDRTPGIVPH
jgi:hypothetical protein